MGHIVYWTIIRAALVIPALYILLKYVETPYWWSIAVMSVYGVVIHPVFIQYANFWFKNKHIIKDTLCSSCKHFDETAVLCMKYDEHPTEEYLPCDGMDWQPESK